MRTRRLRIPLNRPGRQLVDCVSRVIGQVGVKEMKGIKGAGRLEKARRWALWALWALWVLWVRLGRLGIKIKEGKKKAYKRKMRK